MKRVFHVKLMKGKQNGKKLLLDLLDESGLFQIFSTFLHPPSQPPSPNQTPYVAY